MAKTTKFREITIVNEAGIFNPLHLLGNREKYDFESLALLRRLLTNEKAKMIHTIKRKHPGSIYQLAKILGRDFKAVVQDVKLLERFGIVEMISEHTGNRPRLRPRLATDNIQLNIKF